ncbi:SIR2 family NAD-dependent protein deacylase [Niveispirillum irakense]|uniref:SIR2 family NAD-dependent protein deacylase n=1 Tax=Niveispirillum irakense TaxID=34011 RepID=UPI0003FA2671|nr:SIR2 family protein [Niveispirillum irakense]
MAVLEMSAERLVSRTAEAEALVSDLARQLVEGALVPYLGPGLLETGTTPVPGTPEELATFFATKVALPRRAKGNAWASAQHIESTRHRATLSALMAEAFSQPVAPTDLHLHLATLQVPLIVDSWYDGAMRAALSARRPAGDWGEVQGITRAGIGEDRWYRFYDANGAEVGRDQATAWGTLLYKPHGAVTPARNFLISDADYVEVLTEIDIQTPIPDAVKERRRSRGFLYIGCRFHDQLLRTYARQVSKRSGERHFALVDPDILTRNEVRFLGEQGITPIALPLRRAIDILCGTT